jgi:glycosyltransferase involved in cell wall biosynthesis
MKLSIITTVYDRVDCLRSCIASVRALTFKDYEHIIVSDHPPTEISDKIKELVANAADPRIAYHNLLERHNDRGRAAAEHGLRTASGEYLAFLSDDNGYLSNRFEPLIKMLDEYHNLSFVYTSCYYAHFGGILRYSVPEACKIDAGQPVFRRSIFVEKLNNTLTAFAFGGEDEDGDGKLIVAFTKFGTWKFVDDPTFVFRLKDFPQFLPQSCYYSNLKENT